jgi:hypothetical protein
MRELPPPFKLDLRALLAKAKRQAGTRLGAVTIRLPFVSFSVAPNDLEQRVAREVVIRTADRRVLNAFECCDSCIEQALASLQDIRRLLVDKQVELTQATVGDAIQPLPRRGRDPAPGIPTGCCASGSDLGARDPRLRFGL